MTRTLLIFAREPTPEHTKTRLAPILTDSERVRFYEAMLRDVLDASSAATCDNKIVCWAADQEPSRLRAHCRGWVLAPQSGTDLGERMSSALLEALDPAADDASAVIIGTDAPLLTEAHVDQAFDRLRAADLVLGPCFDGGYYLVGARSSMRAYLPAIFDRIPWSTPEVLAKTCERIASVRADADIALALLPMLDDVDSPHDLRRLRGYLHARTMANETVPTRTAAFLLDPPD